MDEPDGQPVRRTGRAILIGCGAVAAVVAICGVLYAHDARQLVQANLDRESIRVGLVTRLLSETYRQAATDARILAQDESLATYLERGDPAQLDLLARSMLHLEAGHPEYLSVRFIDERGRERARADHPQGIVPPAGLQDLSQQPLVQAATALPPGAIFLSEPELIEDGGLVEQPPTPVVRFAVPVFDSQGRRRGMVSINCEGRRLLGVLDQLPAFAQARMRILDDRGYWIRAADPGDDWGWQRPGGQARTLAAIAPELWRRVSEQPEGQSRWRGGWFSWQRAEPSAIVEGARDGGRFLIIASEYSAKDLAADLATLRRTFCLVGAALFAASLGAVAFFESRQRERRRAELALRLAGEAAEESSRLKTRFLANMSHEIRTPMNGVIGMTNLLLETPLTAEQRSLAEVTRTSAESLLNIINDVLDFSKIEAGQLAFRADPFDLRDPVENCVRLLAERAQSKDLELACLIEENVPTRLVGDEGRLHQVLLNLVGNAVKFTERGEVVLRVYKLGEANRRVRLHFVVRDTGIGIDPGTQARLFQPFVQAEGGPGRQFGGTGLGLAICRQLVTMMGGEIGLRSEPGKGSTFWFTAEFATGDGATAAALAKPELAGRRALIVGDNATSREVLARQLAAWKLDVGLAAGRDAALAALLDAAKAGSPFDFALLDSRPAAMSGLELARAIAADPSLSRVKTLILSPIGQAPAEQDLERAGVAACLTKPVRLAELAEALAGRASPGLRAARDMEGREPAAAPPAAKLRILVAEDNLVNQHVARLQLQQFGVEVDIVSSGREAVAAVRQKTYDFVLMDCQMPEMDGFEAARQIRAWEIEGRAAGARHRPLFIIAMTANAMKGDREACLAAGMDDYVTKPVSAADLAAALARGNASVR